MNHRDGVPVTIDSRRYAVFYTAQQSRADLERDGMGGRYFPDLYDWALGRNARAHLGANYGLAVVNRYPQTYAIAEEFNPAGQCQRAPTTSSTAAAVEESRGTVEQEILEAIGQGLPGFAGGWVSSIALERLLERIGRRGHCLVTAGVTSCAASAMTGTRTWPTGAHTGRAPRQREALAVHPRGHLAANLRNPSEIARAYRDAQTSTSGGALPFGQAMQ